VAKICFSRDTLHYPAYFLVLQQPPLPSPKGETKAKQPKTILSAAFVFAFGFGFHFWGTEGVAVDL